MTLARIERAYRKGRIDESTALEKIAHEIGPIRSVRYKEGKTFKLLGQQDQYHTLSYSGLRKKEHKRMQKLAARAYFVAKESGSELPGEVHIAQGISSKHYMGGLQELAYR